MRKFSLPASLGALLLLAVGSARAGLYCGFNAPEVPYCTYSGKVKMVYSNEAESIILYTMSPFDASLATAVGLNGVSYNEELIYRKIDNPQYSTDFARMLYATLLAAQAQGREVTVHMNKVTAGRLSIDTIWLK